MTSWTTRPGLLLGVLALSIASCEEPQNTTQMSIRSDSSSLRMIDCAGAPRSVELVVRGGKSDGAFCDAVHRVLDAITSGAALPEIAQVDTARIVEIRSRSFATPDKSRKPRCDRAAADVGDRKTLEDRVCRHRSMCRGCGVVSLADRAPDGGASATARPGVQHRLVELRPSQVQQIPQSLVGPVLKFFLRSKSFIGHHHQD